MAYDADQPPKSESTDLERGLQGSSDPLSPTFGDGPRFSPSQANPGANLASPEASFNSPALVSQAKIPTLNLGASTPALAASPPPFESEKPSPSTELPALSYNQATPSHAGTEHSPTVSLVAVEKAPNEKVIGGSVVPLPPKPASVPAKPKSGPPKLEASWWIRFNLFFNTYR